MELWVKGQGLQGCRDGHREAKIATHGVKCNLAVFQRNSLNAPRRAAMGSVGLLVFFFVFNRWVNNYLTTTVVAIGCHVVTAVGFTGGAIGGQGCAG
jgi:hypothetical protein